MIKIQVAASRQYQVLVGEGLLKQAGDLAAPLVKGRGAMLVSDDKVFSLYGSTLEKSLSAAGFQVEHFVFPHGEASKNTDTLLALVNAMAEKQLTRADTVFALGGGVTGDMAGLAAALYLRGLACVQLPTTLLAAVDSSVGGKTAVDLPAGKNLFGAFSQPRLVLCDTACLASLPEPIRADGFAEVIKYGMIKSAPLLAQLGEAQVDIDNVIGQCVSIKRDVVEADEFDKGERQLLNFGHTLGHAMEALSGYQMSHGSAVARGMALMTRGCAALGLCGRDCVQALEVLLRQYGLPQNCPYSPEAMVDKARADKKRSGDSINLVLPEVPGRCRVEKSSFETLLKLAKAGMNHAGNH